MIRPINSMHDADKILREMIINLSELDPKKVLNSNSVRGVSLEKLIDTNIYTSYNLNDNIILFDVTPTTSENNLTQEYEDSLLIYHAYKLHLVIYGNSSDSLALFLKARIEEEENRIKMHEKGILIEEVNDITSLNEFINDTLWIRNDLDILFSCSLIVHKDDGLKKFEKTNKIIIFN